MLAQRNSTVLSVERGAVRVVAGGGDAVGGMGGGGRSEPSVQSLVIMCQFSAIQLSMVVVGRSPCGAGALPAPSQSATLVEEQ